MSTSTRHFIRHYVEMVVAMFAGMAVLGIPTEWLLGAAGTSMHELKTDAPALHFLWMAVIMTTPMVALMRWRGHSWRPCWEMAGSMFAPTFLVIALMWTGIEEDLGALMVLEHVLMLPSMLAVMLMRFSEYAGCGHREPAAA
jgi:hypothetical protein